MNKYVPIAAIFFFFFLGFAVPSTAFATVGAACNATTPCAPGTEVCGPSGTCVSVNNGGLGSGCSATQPCNPGLTCGPAGKCVTTVGGGLGSTCSATVPCSAGFTCGPSGTCVVLDGGTTGSSTGLTNPLNGITDLPSLLNAILGAVVKLGAIFLTLMLVYVGFKFVAAQGNAEELKSARTMLVWTVIGGLILLGATAISAVIQSTVGSLM